MSLEPAESLRFDDWDELLRWLPTASERQLMQVFVWANDYRAPGVDEFRLKQAATEAFEEIVRRASQRLRTYLDRNCQCQDRNLAEDVVQETLIRLYLRAETFDPKRSFWGWLFTIARNKYCDILKKAKKTSSTGSLEDDSSTAQLDQIVDDSEPPFAELEKREKREKLEGAIDALPKLQRTVVRLKLAGKKGREIAEELNISQAYVSTLYNEAIEDLGETLADE
ncbi:MAG: DNA-directed RNA polymerase sigma-70 factor [Gemmatales bacterium]|nr:MAG: DNA-directed RNA polymerase sigma-70 factor [Gemmatales bacterium]